MEKAKKSRTALRSMFTRVANQLENLLIDVDINVEETQSTWMMLQEKGNDLKQVDKEIYDLLLETDATEEDLVSEMSTVDEYILKFNKLKIGNENTCSMSEGMSIVANRHSSQRGGTTISKIKLPVIEFKKFGGDIREWLSFWSQFQKIHEDVDIISEDTFQYLLQATIPGTRARELVKSYPPTKENYGKAIESLKSRFGRDDLLIEVYVRELLKLVLQNALSKNQRVGLTSLYDKIETQLRALETLGITTDKCAAMLFPQVESSLPEELLRIWQRSPSLSQDRSSKNRLNELMVFLKSEVEGEERITLAIEGFGLSAIETPNKKFKPKNIDTSVPTAAGLINLQQTKCLFCDGGHRSEDCFKGQKLTLWEKRKVISNKKACFSCLKSGHQSKKCKERLKCLICSGRHIILMCPELPSNKIGSDRKVKKDIRTEDNSTTRERFENSALSNHTNTQVFLPTLRVKVRSNTGEREVRAIIDTGSQRSYILLTTAETLKFPVKSSEKIVHALFGGSNTAEQFHMCYNIKLVSLNEKFSCTFDALDQPVICNNIAAIHDGKWMTELKELRISLSDTLCAEPIELLIGADVAGKLLTGRRHILNCGLVAVETFLGWTLLGKIPVMKSRSTAMITTSLFTKNEVIADLWKLDVIGTTDPVEKKSQRKIAKEHFLRTVSMDDTGRYEVQMSWLEGHPPLSSNFKLSKKRLHNVVVKLRNEHLYESYEKVFYEWLEEGIIENVPEEEIMNSAKFLPHRPVIKLSSTTTKIRPVFDASAHEKEQPALNHCLEKEENLIELIPDLLLQFRINKFGVVSDIRKAFLQISLCKRDRDYLRFLWLKEDGTLQQYRHRRVVFGVCCSPFLLGATIQYHLDKMLAQCDSSESLYNKNTILKLGSSFYVDNCVTSVSSVSELYNFEQEASQIMAAGMFDLRGWEFIQPDADETESLSPVLGMQWNRKNDTLAVNLDNIKDVHLEKIKKRYILSITQKIYDHSVVQPIALFARIKNSKVDW